MSDVDVLGEAVESAMMARAIEPSAGEAPHGAGEGRCLNCGTALIGDYCHVCGQSANVRRSLAASGHDLLHGVFHFEGKIWRSLPMLVRHPGDLTRRYIEGERARFISPMALFLFFVFLMFATIHIFAGGIESLDIKPTTRAEAITKLDTRIAKARGELKRAELRTGDAAVDADDLSELREKVGALQTARTAVANTKRISQAK